MPQKTLYNYHRLEALTQADTEYQSLCREHESSRKQMSALLDRLSEEDIAIITNYIGTAQETTLRMPELACFTMAFPD